MLLQGDLTFCDFGEVGEFLVTELTARDHLIPLIAAYLAVKGLDAVKPESEMAFVLDQPDLVPFADGMGFGNRGVS